MRWAGFIGRAAALALLLALILRPDLFAPLLQPLTRFGAPPIYTQTSLLDLTIAHLGLVGAATLIGGTLAVLGGIFVTRPSGADFLPLSRSIVNIGQTFPPVAVLALAVPAVGFGAEPALIALVLYGLLPVFENTVTGLREVPAATIEAARAMGMGPTRRLIAIELPLALPLILAGLRVSVAINLGTATISSTVAARSLGEVIIAGLQSANVAFILQGGVIVGLLSVLICDAIAVAERGAARRAGRG